MKRFASVALLVAMVIGVAVACFSVPPVQAASQNAVITWQDLPTETGYRVERKTGPQGTWAQVGQNLAANVVTYTDANIAQGTNFFYRIVAFNAIGDGPASDEVQISTAGVPGKVGGVSIQITITP